MLGREKISDWSTSVLISAIQISIGQIDYLSCIVSVKCVFSKKMRILCLLTHKMTSNYSKTVGKMLIYTAKLSTVDSVTSLWTAEMPNVFMPRYVYIHDYSHSDMLNYSALS